MQKLILWTGFLTAVFLSLVLLNTLRQALHLTVDQSPVDRADRLAPHWRILRPDTPGPHGAAILLSGCDGVHDNMAFWAEELVRLGRVAMIVDSHTPRGLDRLEAWRLMCAGQVLTGAERAGDVAVALHALTGMPDVTGDVVLLGASHGGWAAMEFVGLAASGEVPGLAAWPAPPGDLMNTVTALILLYPYCGLLNGADASRWNAPPTLMILAEKDRIVSTSSCLDRAKALRRSGTTIETVIIPGADHGFDQRERSPFSTLEFNNRQRDEARDAVHSFLERHAL